MSGIHVVNLEQTPSSASLGSILLSGSTNHINKRIWVVIKIMVPFWVP